MSQTMTEFPRLIEHAFPLKQASLDSVHEKTVRHGHISTLHIWPARRPLAACRAALIATLLPDPGDAEKRKALCERIGGRVVKKIEKKKMPDGQTVERVKEETEGGILHWLNSEPKKSDKKKYREWKALSDHYEFELEWFRQEIRKAHGGRAPKVLDPFAGGGAIPLEAMRLGCEATAVDINPVAWFILKCTLEYPQKLAGQTRPLPDFILHDDAFMTDFFMKAKGYSKAETTTALKRLHTSIKKKTKPGVKQADAGLPFGPPEGAGEEIQADMAWHVRAWGRWVLARARKELAEYYPTYADFEPLKKDKISYERQAMQLVPFAKDGSPDIGSLNHECSDDYLDDGRNPRWIAKPSVAYLWARTVACKNCRATVPLLKTRWLCKKANKRVLLTMEPKPDRTGVFFGVQAGVPVKGGNAAQKREHDKRIGAGTMSRAGAQCPCCLAINTMEDVRLEGKAGRLGSVMTAVVVDVPGVGRSSGGKAYRLPTEHELAVAAPDAAQVEAAFAEVPFGLPNEPTPAGGGSGAGRAFSVQGYGLMQWRDLFTPRQLLALGTFAAATRAARVAMNDGDSPPEWTTAVGSYLALMLDRLSNQTSALSRWNQGGEKIEGTFARFALPILWDFADTNPLANTSGALIKALWTG